MFTLGELQKSLVSPGEIRKNQAPQAVNPRAPVRGWAGSGFTIWHPWEFPIHGGTPSHHPFRRMGFSLTIQLLGYPSFVETPILMLIGAWWCMNSWLSSMVDAWIDKQSNSQMPRWVKNERIDDKDKSIDVSSHIGFSHRIRVHIRFSCFSWIFPLKPVKTHLYIPGYLRTSKRQLLRPQVYAAPIAGQGRVCGIDQADQADQPRSSAVRSMKIIHASFLFQARNKFCCSHMGVS